MASRLAPGDTQLTRTPLDELLDDRADDRHLLAVSAVPADHRRVPMRRPTAAHQRVDEQPGLIDQDEVGTLIPRLF